MAGFTDDKTLAGYIPASRVVNRPIATKNNQVDALKKERETPSGIKDLKAAKRPYMAATASVSAKQVRMKVSPRNLATSPLTELPQILRMPVSLALSIDCAVDNVM